MAVDLIYLAVRALGRNGEGRTLECVGALRTLVTCSEAPGCYWQLLAIAAEELNLYLPPSAAEMVSISVLRTVSEIV